MFVFISKMKGLFTWARLTTTQVHCRNVHKVKGHSSLQKGGCYEVHDIEDLVKVGHAMNGQLFCMHLQKCFIYIYIFTLVVLIFYYRLFILCSSFHVWRSSTCFLSVQLRYKSDHAKGHGSGFKWSSSHSWWSPVWTRDTYYMYYSKT